MSDVARLNVEIDHDLDEKLAKYIPRGLKSELVRVMLEVLVEDIEKHGRSVIGDVLDRKYRFTGPIHNMNIEERK